MALSQGIAGPVVSIVTSNGILVGIMNAVFQGSIPSIPQIVGIIFTLLGVIVLSTGDMIYKRIMKYLDVREEKKWVRQRLAEEDRLLELKRKVTESL